MRKGMVRCGHCFHPFNAVDNEVPGPRTTAAQPPGATTVVEPTTADAPTATPAPTADPLSVPSAFAALDTDMVDDASATAEQAPAPPPRPEVIRSGRRPSSPTPKPATELPVRHLPPASAPFSDEFDDEEFDGGQFNDQQADDDAPTERLSPLHPAGLDSDTVPARPQSDDGREEVRAAHVRFEPRSLDARYGPRKARPSAGLRLLAGLSIGLLGGLLAVQLIYLYRMEIARDLPDLRPLLVRACAELGCTVPLPHDIALIAVEAAELQSEPGQPGSYQLHLTVTNQAEYLQAWPHLELTLTDGGDSPMARRVLTPEQWAGPAAAAEALAGHQVVAARIPFRSTTATPTGYRVKVFYP